MSTAHTRRLVAATLAAVARDWSRDAPGDLYVAMAERLDDAQLLQSPETAAEAELPRNTDHAPAGDADSEQRSERHRLGRWVLTPEEEAHIRNADGSTLHFPPLADEASQDAVPACEPKGGA